VDEFTISIAPVVLGEGTRLFDRIKFGQVSLEVIDTVPSPRVTHLSYAVSRA
jgi:dihydrofolate reductase